MPVPSSISDLSTTPSLNSPAGTESPSTVDDYLRTHAAFIKQVDGGAVKAADLAATGGAALVGYDGGTVQTVLDDAKPMANYTALRAYTGRATGVRITQSGLAGFFQRDDADTTSADNGGTVIVDASGRRWKRLLTGFVNVKWFGAMAAGNDDTSAIQSAINYLLSVGGGALYFPPGTYLVTSLQVPWGTSPTSIRFIGSGKNATVIKKTGGTTTPVIQLSATLGDGAYSEFSDMHVIGTSSCPAFEATNIARTVWRSVKASGASIGFDSKGSLINTFYDCDLLSNATGYKARKANGVYCNLVEMFGGSIRANTSWGLDVGDTSGLHLYGVDVESNGTSGDVNTGAMITRSTCADEIGYSVISVNGSWFEGNLGTTLVAEACAGLSLSVRDTPFIASQAGRVASVGAVGRFVVDRIIAGSAGDTMTVSAANFVARDSTINTISNTSSSYTLENISTSSGTTQYKSKTASGEISITDGAVRGGTGTVATVSGIATTAFNANLSPGVYEVYASIDGVGGSYMSSARIGVDGTNASRIGGENGANMSITVSGSDIQVTQTSGANQTVRFFYLKIG